MKFSKLNRDIHRWGSIIVAGPIVVIATTGVILQWKKEVGWIQPPSQESSDVSLSIGFDQLIGNLISAPELQPTEVEGLIEGFKSFSRASDFLWRPEPP